jgi:methoxymalonate biosynthesis acyl carrier protein
MDESKQRVRGFLSRFFKTTNLDDADDIFTAGYVNSLFAMQLIAWLEKDFEIAIEDQDLKISNFNSVNSIVRLVGSKSASSVPA